MGIDSQGMKITPSASVGVWGITVTENLEILGNSTYGSVFAKNVNQDNTAYLNMSNIGICKGTGNFDSLLNNYVEIYSVDSGGVISIEDPTIERPVDRILVMLSANGIYTTGTKSRLVKTADYGRRFHYCYEMPSPMFGDIGEAQTDENGECYLFIDDIFKETVTTSIEYQVFLQKEGQGDIWVAEKTEEYFVVKGTPSLKFAWEVKAKQREYESRRLDENMAEDDYSEPHYESIGGAEVEKMYSIDYELEASQMVDAYYKGLEGVFI